LPEQISFETLFTVQKKEKKKTLKKQVNIWGWANDLFVLF